MALFDFLKKNDADVPPDVGKELASAVDPSGVGDAYDPGELEPTQEEEVNELPIKKKGKNQKVVSENSSNKDLVAAGLKIERLEAQIESINSLLKGFNERFTVSNQQIGEIRGIALSNEKTISKLEASTVKAIDIVAEVKPEKIRFDYEKASQRIDEVSAKIESNKEYLNTIIEEMKELKRKAESFIGSEGLINLQKDVKKDLINIQQINAKVQMHADKTEQMFIESQKRANEYSQFIEKLNGFEANYAFMKKDFEKLRVDFTNIATKNELNEIKKRVESKLSLVDGSLAYIAKVKDDSDRVLRLVEDSVSLSKKNEQEIHDIAMTIGDDKISKVGDYDERLNSLLKVIDVLAGQISKIKEKVGLDSNKIKVNQDENKEVTSVESLENIELSPKMSKKLINVQETEKMPDALLDEDKKKEENIEDLDAEIKKADENISSIDDKDRLQPDLNKKDELESIEKIEHIEPSITDESVKPEAVPEIVPEVKLPKKKRVRKVKEKKIEQEKKDDFLNSTETADNFSSYSEVTAKEIKRPENIFSDKKTSFIDRFKTKDNGYIPLSNKHELPSLDQAKEHSSFDVAHKLKNLIVESNFLADRAPKEELENRYLYMKKLYASLPSDDKALYKEILKFYDLIYERFYTESFY